MASPNPRSGFSPALIALHWLMAVMLIALVACIELHDLVPKADPLHNALKQWHFMLGISVFALVWVRILLKIGQRPAILPAPPAWQALLGRAMHLALYVVMVSMPLIGWLWLSAKGKPIPFFFGIELPALISPDKEQAKSLHEIHELGGDLGMILVGLHVAAGLFHHYVAKDNTLLRMLPGNGRKSI